MNVPFETNGHSEHVWEPFVARLEREHPDDVARMNVDNRDGSQSPTQSDEVLALWDRYVDEWVASQ
jgi:hypothetical protein